ncbi:MAG: hypothetical protein U9R74_11715 [Pseudomonadota bacterium]|nr:hypothetical protein [Pseudomonadota bacterium]
MAVHAYQELSLPILRSILESRLNDFRQFSSWLIRQG